MGLAPAGDDGMKVLLFTLAGANQVSVIRVIRIAEPEPGANYSGQCPHNLVFQPIGRLRPAQARLINKITPPPSTNI